MSTLRIGTFNLFQFVEPPYSWYEKKSTFSKGRWAKKTSWVKEQIALMNCDIIGFQEVFSNNALKKLTKELGFEYFVTVDNAKVDNDDSSNDTDTSTNQGANIQSTVTTQQEGSPVSSRTRSKSVTFQ